MGISRIPGNIQRSNIFVAYPDVPVFISATDLYLLYPFFRVTDCGFIEATGEFDLCMNQDQTRYKFINTMPEARTYMYRFIPGNWLAKREGIQKP